MTLSLQAIDSQGLLGQMKWAAPKILNLWRASYEGKVIASSEYCQELGGVIYFPAEDIDQQILRLNDKKSYCIWRGGSQYYDLTLDQKTIANVAWTYNAAKPSFEKFASLVSFDRNQTTIERFTRIKFLTLHIDL